MGHTKADHQSSPARHKEAASRKGPVPVGIVTVSDSRTEESDVNGEFLKNEIVRAGNTVAGYRLVKDEPDDVERVLDKFVAGNARVIIFNGGTGISRRDTTIDVIGKKLEKTLPGFGEIFRMLSFGDIGSPAIFSRATAGVYRGKVIISIPGSPAAVRLAWEKLVAPELQHLAWEVTR